MYYYWVYMWHHYHRAMLLLQQNPQRMMESNTLILRNYRESHTHYLLRLHKIVVQLFVKIKCIYIKIVCYLVIF